VRASVVYWPRLSEKVTQLTEEGICLDTHSSFNAGQVRRIWNKISLSKRREFQRLQAFNPDLVVISQGHNFGGFEWARLCSKASIPYVIIVNCNSEHWWFKEEVDEAIACYTAARRIFCVSLSNLDLLRQQLGEPLKNAEVVRNPYNTSTASPPPWPNERGGWWMASVARIEVAAKGQDLLLQTLARPEWRSRPIDLNLYGSGPDESALRRMARILQLKNVHFHGHVNDIAAVWAQNHLLVLPSRYEGLPLALVESMWCGRPAVVTDVGGNAELCVDSETGFVAPAATPSVFASAMQRAWDGRMEWKRMGQNARIRAEELIPKDPVALFCERLRSCAAAAPQKEFPAQVMIDQR
jgi:glycosyltransferase involved in cell wall biosynthesis